MTWLQILVLVLVAGFSAGAAFVTAELRCVRRWRRYATAGGPQVRGHGAVPRRAAHRRAEGGEPRD